MNHGNKVKSLSRKSAHRKALMRNLSRALIEHKRINTTLAKAKALRTFAEPLITRCKEDSTHNRRVVFRYLQDKNAVTELFTTVAPKIGDRPGGYLRIIKTGFRDSDGAELAMIEFVDFNNVYKNENPGKKTRRRRRTRRGGAGTAATAVTTAVANNEEE